MFSEDRHLRKPGLASPAWREAAQFAVDLAGGVTGQQITGNFATLPFRGGAELAAFLSRKTGISPWIIGGLTAAAAAYVLISPQRRQAVGRYVMPVAEALMKEMERSAALEQHGIAGLRDILLAAHPEPDVKQQAAIVLARHDEPLIATTRAPSTSPPIGPAEVAPTRMSRRASATSLMNPSLPALWIHPRADDGIWVIPVRTSIPCSRARASVSPAWPISGSVKVTPGTAR